jgi:hypothetical protein
MIKFGPSTLSLQDRAALVSLTYQPGWQVLVKLMEARVQQSTVQMLNVAPDEENRQAKLDSLQAVAFAQNSFCDDLMKDVQWQVTKDMEEPEVANPQLFAASQSQISDNLKNALLKAGFLKENNVNSNSNPEVRTGISSN